MAPFGNPSSENVAYGMPIHIKKWFNFETVCRRKNYTEGLLLVAACYLLLVTCLWLFATKKARLWCHHLQYGFHLHPIDFSQIMYGSLDLDMRNSGRLLFFPGGLGMVAVISF